MKKCMYFLSGKIWPFFQGFKKSMVFFGVGFLEKMDFLTAFNRIYVVSAVCQMMKYDAYPPQNKYIDKTPPLQYSQGTSRPWFKGLIFCRTGCVLSEGGVF